MFEFYYRYIYKMWNYVEKRADLQFDTTSLHGRLQIKLPIPIFWAPSSQAKIQERQ